MQTQQLSIGLVAIGLVLRFGTPVLPAWAAEAAQASGARDLLDRYLAMPHPEGDAAGETRQARLEVLAQLSRTSNAVPVIRSAWPTLADPGQRAELAEMLGRKIQTSEAASMLSECLKDPAEEVRWQVVHGLRLLARRTDRVGGRRVPRQPDRPPKIEGLVPALISAAHDPSEKVRVNAMYALADARDPGATQELRRHLHDPSREVRLHAACFLTEFQDASGLPELSQALGRLQATDPEHDLRYYSEAELLLASLERITGKSRGEIPMNPDLSSSTGDIEVRRGRYRKLVDAWSEFLSSDEGKRLLQTLRPVEPDPESARQVRESGMDR